MFSLVEYLSRRGITMDILQAKSVNFDTVLYFCPFAALLLYAMRKKMKKSQSVRYPPGPPADPIIGHARVMPLEYQWYTFAEWGRKFGLYRLILSVLST